MKKIFLFFVFLGFCYSIPVEAATYTNNTDEILEDYKNDEYLFNGQAFTAIGADIAYTGNGGGYTGFSGNGVTVAVIDGGTMLEHQDLENKISPLYDSAFNMYASDHGTHTAGIIAAEKNDIGMHGVAYGSSLMPFSIILGDGCDNPLYCLSWEETFEILADDAYDDVKIINNSWGLDADSSDVTEDMLREYATVMKPLVNKGKLIVAAAGNEMMLTPSPFPAGIAAHDPSLALNLISVVAYNPNKLPSEADFIAEYTNLAGGAQKWSLAAPGTLYSSILYDTTNPSAEKYDQMEGTSMAAPMVSGAAALVSEAFPFLDGKQIADVLFSTAFKKEDLELSPYMLQASPENVRLLFFTDNSQGMTYDDMLAILDNAAISCDDIICSQVTFEDVFGQGLLNAGDAVKGLKYLDADRLTAADYDANLNQFFYTVDTQGYSSVWSNDIGEKRKTDPSYAEVPVGLRKRGSGTLGLSGNNTFEGVSVIEAGILNLMGGIKGAVTVEGGMFILNGGSLNGTLTVNTNSRAQLLSGTLSNNISNQGAIDAHSGVSVTGDVSNSGTFNMSGSFNVSGLFSNKKTLNMENMTAFQAAVNNEGVIFVSGNNTIDGQIGNAVSGNITLIQGSTLQITPALENNGTLAGYGTIDGTVNNNASGTISTSLNVERLVSSGNILLSKNLAGDAIATMHADTLNITGGKVRMVSDDIVYENGRTYTIINFDTLEAFNNFEAETYLTDFIVATTSQESDRIDTRIDYLRMSESDQTASFLPEEKQVLSIVDKVFIDQQQADFGRFYYYSSDGLRKQVNSLRSKVRPVQNEQLPLTKVMASQVHAHLFTNTMTRDAGNVRQPQPYAPMQQYRGKYYRGRAGGDEANRQKVWGQFLGGVFKENGDSTLNQKDITTKSVGAMFGYDYEFSDELLVGLTAGAASARLKREADRIDVKDYRAGLYTGSRFGRVTLNTLAMGGIQKYKSKRFLELAGLSTSNFADFNGYSAEFDINLGYDFARQPYRDHSFYLRSYLAASVNYIHQDAYKEKGNSFLALGVNGMNDTSVSVSPGITLGYLFSEAVITADIGYQRLLSGDSIQRSAYFLADVTKSTFSSLSADTDKDFFNAGVGFKTNLTRNLQAQFWAGTRLSKKTEALNLSATLSYAF